MPCTFRSLSLGRGGVAMRTGLGFFGGLFAIITDLFVGVDWSLWIIVAFVVAVIAVIYLVGIQTIVNIIVLIAALVFVFRWVMS